jgi:uncharacterized protein
MAEMTSYPPGTFCWVDLATNAPTAAKSFYAELFGWTTEDIPTDYEVPYSILKRDGKRAAALYEMAPEQGAFPIGRAMSGCWTRPRRRSGRSSSVAGW